MRLSIRWIPRQSSFSKRTAWTIDGSPGMKQRMKHRIKSSGGVTKIWMSMGTDLQSLKDTQAGYIWQKYNSDNYTLAQKSLVMVATSLALLGGNQRRVLPGQWKFKSISSRKYTYDKYTFGKYTFGKLVDRPTQLICISDIYLLSWRW